MTDIFIHFSVMITIFEPILVWCLLLISFDNSLLKFSTKYNTVLIKNNLFMFEWNRLGGMSKVVFQAAYFYPSAVQGKYVTGLWSVNYCNVKIIVILFVRYHLYFNFLLQRINSKNMWIYTVCNSILKHWVVASVKVHISHT